MALPLILWQGGGAGIALLIQPALVKIIRGARRRRYANEHGPAAGSSGSRLPRYCNSTQTGCCRSAGRPAAVSRAPRSQGAIGAKRGLRTNDTTTVVIGVDYLTAILGVFFQRISDSSRPRATRGSHRVEPARPPNPFR